MVAAVRSVIATKALYPLTLPQGTSSDWMVRRPSSSRQDHTLCGCLVLQGSQRRKAEAGGDIEPSDPRGIPTPSKPESVRTRRPAGQNLNNGAKGGLVPLRQHRQNGLGSDAFERSERVSVILAEAQKASGEEELRLLPIKGSVLMLRNPTRSPDFPAPLLPCPWMPPSYLPLYLRGGKGESKSPLSPPSPLHPAEPLSGLIPLQLP